MSHGGVLAHAVAAAGGRAAAATACHAANTPPSTYRTNAANGMRRHTRIPATSCHAALMKSDIQILTGLSHSISGFGKKFDINIPNVDIIQVEMWANAQCDGLPAKYRRPLFNAAKFG